MRHYSVNIQMVAYSYYKMSISDQCTHKPKKLYEIMGTSCSCVLDIFYNMVTQTHYVILYILNSVLAGKLARVLISTETSCVMNQYNTPSCPRLPIHYRKVHIIV